MVVCTNDGFTGLNRVRLPKSGVSVYFPRVSEAGTETNTEDFADLVPAVSGRLSALSAASCARAGAANAATTTKATVNIPNKRHIEP